MYVVDNATLTCTLPKRLLTEQMFAVQYNVCTQYVPSTSVLYVRFPVNLYTYKPSDYVIFW
jgi:hypothetical protein